MPLTKTLLSAAALAVAGFLALSGLTLAQPAPGGDAGMPPMAGHALSDDERQALDTILRGHEEKIRPLLQQQAQRLDELHRLFHAAGGKPEQSKVQALRKELRDIDAKLYTAEADMLRQMADKGIPYWPHRRGGHHRRFGHGMPAWGPDYGPCGPAGVAPCAPGYGPYNGAYGPCGPAPCDGSYGAAYGPCGPAYGPCGGRGMRGPAPDRMPCPGYGQ